MLHKYLYVQGDPGNLTDPTGHEAQAGVLKQPVGGAIGEYTGLIAGISFGVQVAVEASVVSCDLMLAASELDAYVLQYQITGIDWVSCSATVRKDDDCEREWKNAHDYCSYLNSIPRKDPEWKKYKNIWGGSYDRCVRGQVSQRCGGNRVD